MNQYVSRQLEIISDLQTARIDGAVLALVRDARDGRRPPVENRAFPLPLPLRLRLGGTGRSIA